MSTGTRASTKGISPKARIGGRASLLALRYGTFGLSGRDKISQEQRERNMERIMRAARNESAKIDARRKARQKENDRIRAIANETRARNGLKPLAASAG